MTDKEKLDKVRAEIERRLKGLSDGCVGQRYAYETLLSFMDSMQEEPVSGNIDFEQELYKAFGQVKDFTLGIAIAKRFYDMGRKHNEPISGELEEAAKNHAVERFRVTRDRELAEKCKWSFKAGAQWQKRQEYTCYEEAFEDGASWKKEEMMANAIETTVHIDAGGYPYIPQIELYNYIKDVPLAKEGDKYKVVLIKENKDE